MVTPTISPQRLAQAAVAQHTKPASQVARSGMGKRLLLPAVAAITLGTVYAVSKEISVKPQTRHDPMQSQNNMLMDSYGDKDSLEDLQKAIEAYEKR